jgi:Leucine-rich repeat (LRR) protein
MISVIVGLILIIAVVSCSASVETTSASVSASLFQTERDALMRLFVATNRRANNALTTPIVSDKQALIGSIDAASGEGIGDAPPAAQGGWESTHKWGSDHPVGEWFGVKTDSSSGRVIELELYSNNLQGTLPDLSELSALQLLDLRMNHLSAPIPDSIGNLTSLQHLYLSGNQMKGK